jgi:hypothetical protein
VRKNSTGHYYRFFGKELDVLIDGTKAEYCEESFDEIFISFLQRIVMNISKYF